METFKPCKDCTKSTQYVTGFHYIIKIQLLACSMHNYEAMLSKPVCVILNRCIIKTSGFLACALAAGQWNTLIRYGLLNFAALLQIKYFRNNVF